MHVSSSNGEGKRWLRGRRAALLSPSGYQADEQRLLCSWHRPSNAAPRADLPRPNLLAPGHSGGCCPNGVRRISCSPVNKWGEGDTGQQQTHSHAITHQLGSCGLQNAGLIPRCSLEGFAVYHGWPIAVEALTEGEWEDLPREVGTGTGPIRPSEGCARRVVPESSSLV